MTKYTKCKVCRRGLVEGSYHDIHRTCFDKQKKCTRTLCNIPRFHDGLCKIHYNEKLMRLFA